MKKRIAVVGAAIIENNKLLAAKRSEGRSLGGYCALILKKWTIFIQSVK
ncbi:hypothetical protein JK161_03410 [Leuconostoc mesenteroides]|nr:hypothetical protein [Leuconostoc mesenteroides]MBS0941897.1 hypothetical protein [Leuconostoc mesenteroides]